MVRITIIAQLPDDRSMGNITINAYPDRDSTTQESAFVEAVRQAINTLCNAVPIVPPSDPPKES